MRDLRLDPDYVPKFKEGKIPEASASSIIRKDPEESFYLISFRYYRNDLCEIKDLLKNRGRAGLDALKKIGQSNFRTLHSNGINPLPVEKNGEYTKLFTQLPSPDVDMKEHKLQGESRIFFFLEDIKFNVIAITNSHFETRKHY